MAKPTYREAPVPTKGMPKGIPYIIGNEAAERFSFYGMKAILTIFMVKYLMDADGGLDVMGEEEAKTYYHLFNTAVYFTPLFGAIIADAFFGKYKTILSLSIVYCLGHLALALDETRMGLALGLTLIAIGAGGIKPCVSAHVGDQFGKSNQHLLEKVFSWFYFSINLGSGISTLLTPWLLSRYGPSVAFGIPGALMLLATIVFWMGRNVFVHIPAQGVEFVKETFSGEGLKAIGQLVLIYAFVAMFWALFDQTGSAWVLQAERMDRNFLGTDWYSSQIQAINPIMIMTFIPLFTYLIYPTMKKFFKVTPLRKIGIGLFITGIAFLIPAWIESQLSAGIQVNIGWQLAAYAFLTAAEVMVSITALEFSYTQAPKKMKSLIMGFYLMSVSMGNLFTAGVNVFIQEQAVVAKNLPAEGSQVVTPEKTTRYVLSCESGGETDEIFTNVSVAIPFSSEKKEDPDSPQILSFGPKEGVSTQNRVLANKGESITLQWKATQVSECTVFPVAKKGGAEGEVVVKPEKPTTYVLSCQANRDETEEVEKRIRIMSTDGPAIQDFTVEGAVSHTIRPPGGDVTLAWNAKNADSCEISAEGTSLSPVGYYLFFAGIMFVVAILFIFVALRYREKTYIQEEVSEETPIA